MAECHPVGLRWVMQARERGATIIHVDPRFTRTSAVANIHVPIRAGTDIAFLGGIIRYILENDRHFHDYVVNYTNAAAIIEDGFEDTDDLNGIFSGWNKEEGKYDTKTWMYKDVPLESAAGAREPASGKPVEKNLHAEHTDPTLQDPHCVFQILKRHYSRYTPEMVEETCGIAPDQFRRVAETLCRNSGRERTGAFCLCGGLDAAYFRRAVHPCGVHHSVASWEMPAGPAAELWPCGDTRPFKDRRTFRHSIICCRAICPCPRRKPIVDLETYIKLNQSPSGWWGEFPKYIVSLLKAWYGDAATAENNYCFDHLPRLTGGPFSYEHR